MADAEDPAALRAALRSHDVVIDAAGPFQQRSTTLVEACLTIGCDVIDLADSFDYLSKIHSLAPAIARAGVRVLTACSSVSAVSAALVRLSGVQAPVRVSTFLAPAIRKTATPGTSISLLSTLDRPVRLLRNGSIVRGLVFSQTRAFTFPPPIGEISARLAESADAITLPRVWPSLRDVDFWVDTRRRLLNSLIATAARSRSLGVAMRGAEATGRRIMKYVGSTSGGFGIELKESNGDSHSSGFLHPNHSYIVAVVPAVLAARRIAAGSCAQTGLVPSDRQVDPWEMVGYLRESGISDFGIQDKP
jgi:saccharopine dehydrogenase-like protein